MALIPAPPPFEPDPGHAGEGTDTLTNPSTCSPDRLREVAMNARAPLEAEAMQTSVFLAKLIGPILLVMGMSMLTNADGFRAMAQEFLRSRALIYLAGLIALVPGLAIVLVHNVWVLDWRVIITLFGWLGIIGGVLRLLLPEQVSEIGTAVVERKEYLAGGGVAVITVGLFLSLFGYFI